MSTRRSARRRGRGGRVKALTRKTAINPQLATLLPLRKVALEAMLSATSKQADSALPGCFHCPVVRITCRYFLPGAVEVENESVMLGGFKQDQQPLESLLCVLSCWSENACAVLRLSDFDKHWWNSKCLL